MIETISQLTFVEWGKAVLMLSSWVTALCSVFCFLLREDQAAIYAILMAMYGQIILNT